MHSLPVVATMHTTGATAISCLISVPATYLLNGMKIQVPLNLDTSLPKFLKLSRFWEDHVSGKPNTFASPRQEVSLAPPRSTSLYLCLPLFLSFSFLPSFLSIFLSFFLSCFLAFLLSFFVAFVQGSNMLQLSSHRGRFLLARGVQKTRGFGFRFWGSWTLNALSKRGSHIPILFLRSESDFPTRSPLTNL